MPPSDPHQPVALACVPDYLGNRRRSGRGGVRAAGVDRPDGVGPRVGERGCADGCWAGEGDRAAARDQCAHLKKETLPEGVAVLVTVALKVTRPPRGDGSLDEVSPVRDLATTTDWVRGLDCEPTTSVLPKYEALIVWVNTVG